MAGIITSEGLQELVDKKLVGEKLPDGWEKLVDSYIEFKIRAASMKKEIFLECKKTLEEAEDARRFLHGRKKDY